MSESAPMTPGVCDAWGMRRRWVLIGSLVAVAVFGTLSIVSPSELTLALAMVSALPLVWVAADRDGPPGSSPPGPWGPP